VENNTNNNNNNSNNNSASNNQENNNDDENEEGANFLQIASTTEPEMSVSFNTMGIKKEVQLMNNNKINELKDLLLLDNQSTTDLWCNKNKLQNIRKVSGKCTVVTNGGQLNTNMKGYLPNYGDVWYHPQAITNILSLSNVKKHFKVTFDSESENCFKVHVKDKILKFKELKSGLYAIKLKEVEYIFLNTVEDKMSKYSQRQIKGAEKARELYGIIGYPSIADYKNMIKMNLINDCPITIEDIKNAEDIYEPDIAVLKGKTVRKKPIQVKENFIQIPKELKQAHKNVKISADVLFVNKIPILVTISENIGFTTVEILPSRKIKVLAKAFDNVIELYGSKGFNFTIINTDPEFATVIEHMTYKKPQINPTSTKEHVPRVERNNRTIKERVRARRSRLPYKKLPKALITHIVIDVVRWLNNFIKSKGLQGMSPRAFMTGVKFD
jgi:hypothetical protein